MTNKISKIIKRKDNSEIKINLQKYYGSGLHLSIGVDVFYRKDNKSSFVLLNDRPHQDWKKMTVDEYLKNGKSEVLKLVKPIEILSFINYFYLNS
jgi:hypothetical protein